ncbi:MAG TPA: exopolysaccharide biosynthesis protein [Phenylobacterium sp.]
MADTPQDLTTSISEILRELCADPKAEITVGQIVRRFGRRAFGAVLFLFSTPNLLPLPPGSSTVLGAPLVLLAPQLALGVHAPWIPKGLASRTITGAQLANTFGRMLPFVERAERITRPRLPFMFGPVGERLIGLVCTLLALVLILPIFGANMLPAAAVGLLSLSLVQRDGALALIGYLTAAVSVGVLALMAGAVVLAVQKLLHLIGAA